jgi:hypothetical protein
MCQESLNEFRNNAERTYVIILASDKLYINAGCQMFTVLLRPFSGSSSYDKLRAMFVWII